MFMTRKASEKDKYTAAKLDQWEVYSNQVAIQSRLGEGAFGEVYRGLFDSSITEKSSTKKFDASNSVVVAVKLLRGKHNNYSNEVLYNIYTFTLMSGRVEVNNGSLSTILTCCAWTYM